MTQEAHKSTGRAHSGAVRRILVATKYRFIGDTLLATPLLRAIARQWPEARITLLSGAKACELLSGSPVVHHVVEFDPYRRRDQGIANYVKLLRTLRTQRFDLAFVCNRSFQSALTAFLAGAKSRVGWSGFEGRDFLLTHTAPYDSDAPEVDSYLDLFERFARVRPAQRSVVLWIGCDECASVEGRVGPGKVVMLQPGASHAEKRWPPSRFAELAVGLLEQDDRRRIVLVGGPDESAEADETMAAIPPSYRSRVVSLVGKLSLRETLAALTFAELFVGGDTAIRHAAVALGPATVALFGPTSARKWGNADPPKHTVLRAPNGQISALAAGDVLRAAETAHGAWRSPSSATMSEVAP